MFVCASRVSSTSILCEPYSGFFSLSCVSCSFSFKLGHRAKRCLFGSFFVKESDECAADALDTPHGAAPNSTC